MCGIKQLEKFSVESLGVIVNGKALIETCFDTFNYLMKLEKISQKKSQIDSSPRKLSNRFILA